jgi:hypothetical protein
MSIYDLTHEDLPDVGIHTHGEIDRLLPAQAEKDALLGSFGTPGYTNRYLTNGDAPAAPAASRLVRLDGAGILALPAGGWRLGGAALALDLTGTEYDAKAALQALGVHFSDADAPFPGALYGAVAGSWAHAAGLGWRPATGVDDAGPGLLVPLMRPGNWELAVGLSYPADPTTPQLALALGYLAGSNHCGAAALIRDAAPSSQALRASLETNDGDDTFTVRYQALATVGPGSWTYKFRCFAGAVSVWDDYDDTWHDHAGRQAIGHAYTAAYAFVQFLKTAGSAFPTCYLSSLTLTYLA